MTRTANISVNIDNVLKERAEKILSRSGITPKEAIEKFYEQIVITGDIPFDTEADYSFPPDASRLTREELAAEIEKGMDSIRRGEYYTVEEVFDELLGEYDE